MDRFNTVKLFIEEHKIKLVIALIFIIILITSTIIFLNIDTNTKTKTESIVFANLNNQESDVNEEVSDYVFVDIKGEVERPGVYSLKNDKRVVDAINLAGGLSEFADTTLLNLSLKIKDQMVIVVYSKDDIANFNLEVEEDNQINICNEEIINDACIVNNTETIVIPNLFSDLEEETQSTSDKVNINTADIKLLKTIPKIGEVKAKAIISYRETNGNFQDILEIKNVKGIGDNIFEAIKEYITV